MKDTKHDSEPVATAVLAEGAGGVLLPGSIVPKNFQSIDLPGCEIVSLLGKGGMGVVFLARQERLDRHVAVKMLPPDIASRPGFIRRLENEALTLAAMSHPNIVGCYDIVSTDGGTFMLMEFVPGQLSVRDLILRFRRMPEAVVARIGLEVALGLGYAHEKGVCHGDIKPENLLFHWESMVPPHEPGDLYAGAHSRVMICDFGISHQGKIVAEEGEAHGEAKVLGSPPYMAPEQIRPGSAVDHRADIYALGTTLYQLLTAHLPFHGETHLETIRKKASSPAPDPRKDGATVSDLCAAILMKMCAPRLEDRHESYTELIEELQNLVKLHEDRPSGRIAYRSLGSFWRGLVVGASCFFVVGIVVGGLHLRTLFVSPPVSRAASLGYWDGERSGWRLSSPDAEMDGPALTVLMNASALTLKQPAGAGWRVRLKMRLPADGCVRSALVEGDVERLSLDWRRRADGQGIAVLADGREIPVADVAERKTMSWLPLDLRVHEKKIVVYVDGEPICIAPLKHPITDCRLMMEMREGHMAQFRDVWLTKKK
ncbi:MAG: serine/threonine protein kinase [Lentisphaeria bacterium]|nr:serine/threonine protein kinase [Lentisphaeria bacterium]